MNRNAPTTVAKAIRATARKTGHTYGDNEQPTYRGCLQVKATWGNYTRATGPERLTRADAVEDADRARQNWINVNQLPN